MRGGSYTYSNGNLYVQFTRGRYWLTLLAITEGINIDFYPDGVNQQRTNSRGYGFSIRCLSR